MISVKYWLDILEAKALNEGLTPFERYNYRMSKMYYDPRIKEVGDKVMIWDTSLMVNFETEDYINDPEIIFKLLQCEGIIVEDNLKYEVVTNMVNDIDILDRIFLDLIVIIPNMGLKIRTHSDFVRLL